MSDFIFGGSKITAGGDCSHEIKRCLLLGRIGIDYLIYIIKKIIKKAEHQRIDAFELWCWRRLLRVSWTARRSNQSILKEILGVHWKDWCWSWNSNTLATWCEHLTHLKRPDAGKDWGQEEKWTTEDEMVGWHCRLNGHEFEWTLGVGDEQGGLVCCSPWGHKESDMTERLNWTELNSVLIHNKILFFAIYVWILKLLY